MMIKRYTKIILVFLVTIFHTGSTIYGSGTTAAEFLKLGISPTAEAMGTAFTAYDREDITAINYNPAILGFVLDFNIGWQHLFLFDSMSMNAFNITYPLLGGIIGGNFLVYQSGDFIEIGSSYNRSLNVSSYLFSIAYARELKSWFTAGIVLKYIYESWIETGGASFAVDIGVIKTFFLPSLFKKASDKFTAGIVLNNIGLQLKGSSLPFSISTGINYNLLNFEIHKLNLLSDLVIPLEDNVNINIGFEYTIYNLIFIRAGYKLNHKSRGFTCGLGINYRGLELNYAFLYFGDLGTSHLIGVTINIENIAKEIEK